MSSALQIFTKPNCPFCDKAKDAIQGIGLSFEEHDVTACRRNADLSVYLSGVSTVPQALLGDLHINGSRDILALTAAARLKPLVMGVNTEWDVDVPSDADLAAGVEDIVLHTVLPESDGTRSDDPEEWALLHFYKGFFGFWPNAFYYLHHWPEAYKLYVYAHNIGAIRGGLEFLGAPVVIATGYATSHAHGCNYCQVHITAGRGEQSLAMPKLIEAARAGKAPADAPIGPFELALADLAAAATDNIVTTEQLDEIRSLVNQARISGADVDTNITGVSMIASAFGFFNTFNDLTGVKVEAEWAKKAEAHAGVTAGRHGVSEDRASDNLDHDLPEGGPSLDDMIARYERLVAEAGGVEAFALRELGIMPSWIRLWPKQLRARHILLYAETMQTRDHSPIPSELKHLMARVSAISKGHDYLAAIEGFLSYKAAGRSAESIQRVRFCFEAARGRDTKLSLFTTREHAALKLAWLSAQTPLTTPRRFIQPALDAWSPVELIHLITVCSIAGMVQRFAAIAKPEIETKVEAFFAEYRLMTDTLAIRYPLRGEQRGEFLAHFSG